MEIKEGQEFSEIYKLLNNSRNFKKVDSNLGLFYKAGKNQEIITTKIALNSLCLEITAILLTNEYMQVFFKTEDGDQYINVLYRGLQTFTILPICLSDLFA